MSDKSLSDSAREKFKGVPSSAYLLTVSVVGGVSPAVVTVCLPDVAVRCERPARSCAACDVSALFTGRGTLLAPVGGLCDDFRLLGMADSMSFDKSSSSPLSKSELSSDLSSSSSRTRCPL